MTPELPKGLLIGLTASILTLGAHTVFVTPVDPSRGEALSLRDGSDAGVECPRALGGLD